MAMKGTMKMDHELHEVLKRWDGKRVAYLQNQYTTQVADPAFFNNLVIICFDDPNCENATTWLLKYHVDSGNKLPQTSVDDLLANCTKLTHWEAKLHILQMLPSLEVSFGSMASVENFVRICLKESNKFVRAWAYNGMYELKKYMPELQPEVLFLCQKAMETESPAVKARVNKVIARLQRNS